LETDRYRDRRDTSRKKRTKRGKADRQTRAGGDRETGWDFAKERFTETKRKKVKCFLKELLI
jgi:hypothetical protein